MTFSFMTFDMPLVGSRQISMDYTDLDDAIYPVTVVQVEGFLVGLTLGTFEVELRAVPSNDLIATLEWTANGVQRVKELSYQLVPEGQTGLKFTVTSAGIGVNNCMITTTVFMN
jgi:hypothetical protein